MPCGSPASRAGRRRPAAGRGEKSRLWRWQLQPRQAARPRRWCRRSGNGEKRAGQGLGRAIAGKEIGRGNPTRCDHGLLQQWQNHMAAAEHQGAGAVEGREQRKPAGCGRKKSQAQQCEETSRPGTEGRCARFFEPVGAWDGAGTAGRTRRPKTAPNASTRIWPNVPGSARAMQVASKAAIRRGRSGQRLRVISHTAWATTAMAASCKPCRAPPASRWVCKAAIQWPARNISKAEGRVKPHQAARPAEPAGPLQARGKTRPGWKRGRAETGTAPEGSRILQR